MSMDELKADKFRERKVSGGRIVCGRRTYRPLPGVEPYRDQLDGKWCRFGRALGWGGRPTGFLILCGVRGDDDASYVVTPEVWSFRTWYVEEEED